MTPDADMIPRAEADRQTQEAVAAVLMEALAAVSSQRGDPDNDDGLDLAEDAIRAMIPDAAATLAKWGARVRKEALMDAAIYFGADEETAEERKDR